MVDFIIMVASLGLLLLLGAFNAVHACAPAPGTKIRIGSFNVKQMGQSKLSKPDVMDVIYRIMGRYDILLMQEITDVNLKTIPEMHKQINSIEKTNPFNYVASERLGRSDNKEQYVLWYRSGVSVISTHQYSDPKDVFEREPYLVVVNIPQGKTVQKVGLMNIHTKPDDAVEELNELPIVYDYYLAQLNLQNILIGGDFNADCNYVSNTQLSKLTLRTDKRFAWLIPDDADTNVASSSCAYDRFVVAGSPFLSGLDNCTAAPFRFDSSYGLSADFTAKVSDHYPIDIQMFSSSFARRKRSIGN